MKALLDLLPLLAWAAVWIIGGWLLAGSLFCLRRAETGMAGLSIGLIVEVWLANLLARFLPIVAACWVSAAIVLAGGLGAHYALHRRLDLRLSWKQWLSLGVLSWLFTSIGRGLGIFDDYQNLPTISLMATGDIPPHFALDQSLNFGYHYFLLLFSAQLMRLGHMFPWTALDGARGLMMTLPLVLAGLWAFRVTRSQLASFLTVGIVTFAGGARWLLLLLPTSWLAFISDRITLIGSASTSAPNLAAALLGPWKIDGAGPLPFPFAFYTGINQPFVMAYTGISGSGILVLLTLLLIANRRRHWSALIIVAVLVAALAIANEIAFLLLGLGFALVLLGWVVGHRSWRLPSELWKWAGVLAAALVVAAIQGGLLTEAVRGRILAAGGQQSYFDTSLVFAWPPSIVSAHLGSLSILNPAQLIAGLAEIGPVVLVTPLLLIWARKAYRAGSWYEATLIASSAGAPLALFVAFKGPLFTATPRLMSGWFFACILYAVPLLWVWARRRAGALQAGIAVAALVACLGGVVLFGVQLLAVQRPVLSTFLTPMDAKMSQDYWNRLEPNALVFDPVVFRAPTVFGRFTASSPTWYITSPAWDALSAAPTPASLRAAGFRYAYFGKEYWDGLTSAEQQSFSGSCVKQVAQVEGVRSERDYSRDFRRLLNIENCR